MADSTVSVGIAKGVVDWRRLPFGCPESNSSWGSEPRLEGAVASLFVNVAEALALLALLEDHGDGNDEQGIDADEAEDSGEDVVKENVGEG